eukprot:gnl/MRDRNA2_/MRDRNA2_256161_c0_seq1.p1 gnl/MRDRNA2_/MRDRNA2_256161_c0~~gnl/MRDRNA2_/MRDRNA2_256161_c0_seq1.p1  ORF type:complete len:265 (-),score=54.40 gnl/MRDRNA2_/MRDRNA2_256161_c0_seq1:107-820(-)
MPPASPDSAMSQRCADIRLQARCSKLQDALKAERKRNQELESALDNAPGHANPRQRIRLVTSLKQENASLRSELQKLKQKHILSLGASHNASFSPVASESPIAVKKWVSAGDLENRPPPIPEFPEHGNALQEDLKENCHHLNWVGVVRQDGNVSWSAKDVSPSPVTCTSKLTSKADSENRPPPDPQLPGDGDSPREEAKKNWVGVVGHDGKVAWSSRKSTATQKAGAAARQPRHGLR